MEILKDKGEISQPDTAQPGLVFVSEKDHGVDTAEDILDTKEIGEMSDIMARELGRL